MSQTETKKELVLFSRKHLWPTQDIYSFNLQEIIYDSKHLIIIIYFTIVKRNQIYVAKCNIFES